MLKETEEKGSISGGAGSERDAPRLGKAFRRDNTRKKGRYVASVTVLVFVGVPPGKSNDAGVPVSLPTALGKGKSLCSQESTPDLPGSTPDALLRNEKEGVGVWGVLPHLLGLLRNTLILPFPLPT